ncbi:MAG: hypothetical protein IT167_12180 [Bryobacterales bacterium]|nr:hypothetical protein [Bryobacterales bacterium]
MYSSNASDAQVVAIDETIATGSSIDIRTGALSQITLACAEIEAAKKYYDEKASSIRPDGKLRSFVIVSSMCVSEDGSLWAIILPSDVRVGLNIAHFDRTGKHITSILCEVPLGRKPIGLTVMGRTLFLGLSDAELLAYPV